MSSLPTLPLLLGLLAVGTAHAGSDCPAPEQASYAGRATSALFAPLAETGLPALHTMLEQRTDCPIELHDYPTARAWSLFAAGNLDIVLGAIETPERSADGEFVEFGSIPFLLATSKRWGLMPPSQLSELEQRPLEVVGVVRGTRFPGTIQLALQGLEAQSRIDYSVEYTIALKKLKLGRIQLLATNLAVLLMEVPPEHLRDDLNVVEPANTPRLKVGVYLSKKSLSPRQRDTLRKELQGMRTEGLLQRYVAPRIGPANASLIFGHSHPPELAK